MSTSKNFDKIAIVLTSFALVFSLVLMTMVGSGYIKVEATTKYERLLFDDSRVHTIDIEIDDWEGFLETCENEEYTLCNVNIDGTRVNSVGIRAKGNTSLSSVKQSGSSRYSFKIEFDHYDSGITYYGLDKLCLNNIIQDNTYMKDYLAYTLMREMGVAAPLCSYVYLTVNGEDWGLYLAVEAVEDSFISRNYEDNDGELYKPDSLSFGGGRGNGKDFDMEDFQNQFGDNTDNDTDNTNKTDRKTQDNFNRPDGNSQASPISSGSGFTMPDMNNFPDGDKMQRPDSVTSGSGFNIFDKTGGGGMGGFGMGSSDVKLQYIDDNISSYSNIFDNAKTDPSGSDKNRLISSLKTISDYINGEDVDIESAVDIESVIKYFVVHTYLCNGDSYTGSMIHNYYLYEEDGLLSMIPWDYNLAFGGFAGNNATSQVNSDIYNPVSGDLSDRPMIAWIFESEEYTALYEQYYEEFLSIDINAIIEKTYKMIAKYVNQDPTKFCTYDEFVTGKENMSLFCQLRTEACQRQLAGDTTEVDASSVDISAMGSMGNMGGGGGFNSEGNSFDPNNMEDFDPSNMNFNREDFDPNNSNFSPKN